jgi:putative endonuclease
MNYYTYITTNPAKTVFYTGVTNNLKRRMNEHRNEKGTDKHFAEKYYCHKLIYYETFESILEAIAREKEIKNISRKDKIELIKSKNPEMAFYLVW